MFALLLAATAHAATLAGVTLADAASVSGQRVALNGVGLREKLFIDIYVGGLYLTHTTHDPAAAIAADEPKRILMHFIYSKVTRAQIVETFEEGFGTQPGVAAQKANIDALLALVPEQVVAGQELALEYSPGKGTSLVLDGRTLGTIPGAEFMKLVWNIYLGPHPPTEELKRGLLGNG
jgi:hypothetical protein